MALRGPTGRAFASLILIAAAVGGWSASAQAATVTVGSPIAKVGSGGVLGPSGNTETVANTALPEADAHVTSPVNGTIVSWRMVAQGPGTYALRVLRPQGDGTYLGVGSAPVTGVNGDRTFSANLPIQAGDLIGLNLANGTENGVRAVAGTIAGAGWDAWIPAIPEGGAAAPFPSGGTVDQELAFNAVVQYPDPGPPPATNTPTTPTKKKCKKKKKHKRSAESAKKKCKKKKKKR